MYYILVTKGATCPDMCLCEYVMRLSPQSLQGPVGLQGFSSQLKDQHRAPGKSWVLGVTTKC